MLTNSQQPLVNVKGKCVNDNGNKGKEGLMSNVNPLDMGAGLKALKEERK